MEPKSSERQEYVAAIDRLHDSGLLTSIGNSMLDFSDVFSLWSAGDDGAHRLFDSGTMCFVDTGSAKIGVTADHCTKSISSRKRTRATRSSGAKLATT